MAGTRLPSQLNSMIRVDGPSPPGVPCPGQLANPPLLGLIDRRAGEQQLQHQRPLPAAQPPHAKSDLNAQTGMQRYALGPVPGTPAKVL